MKAEIITVGSELLLGQVMDTNTRYAARELARNGFEVYHHSTVGDNLERLTQAVIQAEQRAEIILLIGGLGPTKDDITREILAEHLGLNLVAHDSSYDELKERFEQNGKPIPPGNIKMAQVIENAKLLPNDTGAALGNIVYTDSHVYAVLPGPPSECEPMIHRYFLPELVKKTTDNGVLRSASWRLYGITEPETDTALEEILLEQTNPSLAIYVEGGEIIVRSTAKADTAEKAEKMLSEMKDVVMKEVGAYHFSDGENTLPKTVMNLLIDKQISLVLVEEPTDGQVYQLLTPFDKEFHAYIPCGLTLPESELRPLSPIEAVRGLQNVFQTTLGVAVYNLSTEKSEGFVLTINDNKGNTVTYELSTHFGRQTAYRAALEVLNTLRKYLLDL